VGAALPHDLLRLRIEHDSAGTRSLTLDARGPLAKRVLARFRNDAENAG
jgi:hypothetical protein